MKKFQQIKLSGENGYNLISYSQDINKETTNFIVDQPLTDEIINKNFKWLENNLLDNQRVLSNLDFYRIEGTVDSSNIQAVFNNMIKNTSAIVIGDCELNGIQYAVGDLVYKQNNGQPQPLKLGNGFYYPKFSGSGNAIIEWHLTNKTPNVNDGENTTDPKQIYKQELIMGGNLSYSEIFTQAQITKKIKISCSILQDKEGKDIIPVVEGFYSVGNKMEIVYWDYYLTKEGNYWYINSIKIPSIVNQIMVK